MMSAKTPFRFSFQRKSKFFCPKRRQSTWSRLRSKEESRRTELKGRKKKEREAMKERKHGEGIMKDWKDG